MKLFQVDPEKMDAEELHSKVRFYRRIVFGGMALAVVAYAILRTQGMFNEGVRRAFVAYMILLFPFTIPLNRLHREYFSRKREES